MKDSVHHSPWPTLDEIDSIPVPVHADTYPALVEVLNVVRKAKAEANLSMRAPVNQVRITAEKTIIEALQLVVPDMAGMLHISNISFVEGKPESGLTQTEVEI